MSDEAPRKRRKARRSSAPSPERIEATYEVGYGRPPKNSRFPTGKSGNPGGVSKKPKPLPPLDLGTLLHEVLAKPTPVKVNGREVTVPLVQAIMTAHAYKAAKGEVPSFRSMITLISLVAMPRIVPEGSQIDYGPEIGRRLLALAEAHAAERERQAADEAKLIGEQGTRGAPQPPRDGERPNRDEEGGEANG